MIYLKMFIVRTLKDLSPVLFQKPKNLESEVYYVIRDADLLHGSEPNITIIPPHKINQEFPKTFGHYHNHGETETYRVLYGKASLLIQKPVNNPNFTPHSFSDGGLPNHLNYNQIAEVKLLRAKAGQSLKVPAGFGHCLINLSQDLLVTADWESENAGHIYEPIQKLHGFCYYIVEENGRPKAIKNNNYQKVPDFKLF